MGKSPKSVPTLRPSASNSAAIARITTSAQAGDLVAIIGTGVSIGLTNNKVPALSWKGLIQDGFSHGEKKGKISPTQANAWKSQIASDDLDDLLAAAEFMGRKLGAPDGDLYARWLETVFKDVKPESKKMMNAVKALQAFGVPLCTLNYDSLLERVTGLPSINLNETRKVAEWMRHGNSGILHLHGSWDEPSTCILGIRDYEATIKSSFRELLQRSLASFGRLLFIGCGDTFADPNFSALIRWLREKLKAAGPEHYALVREDEVAGRHADPAWLGFVEPCSYGEDHASLPTFLLKHLSAPKITRPRKKATPATASTSEAHSRLLQAYRSFLLKDCGQMTIEGVKADLDTAQQRFDLERLFVPLKILKCAPDIPDSDPQRDQKLLAWKRKNNTPRPFGETFAKHQNLALLALPGGGKTLLLKRLAVAYADPSRRCSSEDNLPPLDLMPVLIRCREWREHIKLPILTLLKNLPDITGNASLIGINDALLPLFRSGQILLLIDGLDEIHDDALRSTFVEHLERFIEDYKTTRLVVTSREAGFSLVAPCLARFCERWRVAPLQPDAITALCNHWHRLMTGDSPTAMFEAQELAQHLIQNISLHRLAENPLLLTMLLVVKHGAGRLPPDRVSLYGRAVEVLLDTWNIKGHEPLNLKEAIPQLACVAFQLMRAGKQTVTENDLLDLLEEARDNVPQIRRYAKDTPHAFLKRVELRSGLLVKAGHQSEGGQAVPFYQFRHLTFQEYLAAVAAAEGHYMEYKKGDTVLTPLAVHLTTDEWKETIPMAAVLARKQAEPLMAALVAEGVGLRKKLDRGEQFEEKRQWVGANAKLPAPIARIFQCLTEEAEATQETLTVALQLVALFARGCRSADDWRALSRGPYGEELLHQAWLLYAPMKWPSETWLPNTLAVLARHRRSTDQWLGSQAQTELMQQLQSHDPEQVVHALLVYSGLLIDITPGEDRQSVEIVPVPTVEEHLFNDNSAVYSAAAWLLGLTYRRGRTQASASPTVLNRLLDLWLRLYPTAEALRFVPFALCGKSDLLRSEWEPSLTDSQIDHIRMEPQNGVADRYDGVVRLIVAFHSRSVWSDAELARRLQLARDEGINLMSVTGSSGFIDRYLEQMGAAGRRYLPIKKAGRSRLDAATQGRMAQAIVDIDDDINATALTKVPITFQAVADASGVPVLQVKEYIENLQAMKVTELSRSVDGSFVLTARAVRWRERLGI